ncbi:MAG: hypothetical protein ACON38_06195 [Akkermansiaceae bacterium]
MIVPLRFTLSTALLFLIGCQEAQQTGTQKPDDSDNQIPPIRSLTLAKRNEKPEGQPLFEKIPPSQTGIDFTHVWKPRSKFDEALQKTGFTGGGVALGDYDNDGACDLLFTSPTPRPHLEEQIFG